MTTQFTAGPWVCEPTDSEGPDYGVSIIAVDLGEDGLPLFSPTRGLVGAALPWPTEIDSGDMSRVEANANLMASAPALLEALEEAKGLADMAVMSDDMDGTESEDQGALVRLRAKIDAAIALARTGAAS